MSFYTITLSEYVKSYRNELFSTFSTQISPMTKKILKKKNQIQFSTLANNFADVNVGKDNQIAYSFKESFQLISKRFPTVLIYSVNGE